MIDDIFVIDGVAHAFDLSEANFAKPRFARPINDLLCNLLDTTPEGYVLNPSAFARNWTVEDTEKIFWPVPQLTREHQHMILGRNIARLHGLDIQSPPGAIKDDEFAIAQAGDLAPPYSITPLAGAVISLTGVERSSSSVVRDP